MPIGKLLIEKGVLKPEPVVEEETKETSMPLEKEKSAPAKESAAKEKSATANTQSAQAAETQQTKGGPEDDEELDVKADTPKPVENATPDPDAEAVVKEETKE